MAVMKFYMDGEVKSEEETGDVGSTSVMEKMQEIFSWLLLLVSAKALHFPLCQDKNYIHMYFIPPGESPLNLAGILLNI